MMMATNTLDGVKDTIVGSHQEILEFKDITVFTNNILKLNSKIRFIIKA
jgi:hypothetical protein